MIVKKYAQDVGLCLRHKLESVLAIGQLHHQLATAPGCTIQCVLPLPIRRSANQFLAAF